MLVQGSQLLSELLPKLARSALHHNHLVAVVDERHAIKFSSATSSKIPGTIFLSSSVLQTPWQAAEYLFHEALHQKFLDVENTHSIFRRGYRVANSPQIRSLWNRSRPDSSNDWPINRALAAFHVYVHLALFFIVVEVRAPELVKLYGPLHNLEPAISARRAFDRAHYLGNQLKQLGWEELGLAGQRLVDWLFDILALLDPAPPPADAYVHLLLDLYNREAEQTRKLLSAQLNHESESPLAASGKSAAQQILPYLIQSELAVAERISSQLGNLEFSCSFNQADQSSLQLPSQVTDAELAAAFQAARACVSDALRRVPPESFNRVYQAEPTKTLGQLVQEMVKHSSQHLNTLDEYLTPIRP